MAPYKYLLSLTLERWDDTLIQFKKCQKGTTPIEYGLISALVAGVAIAGASGLADSINDATGRISSAMKPQKTLNVGTSQPLRKEEEKADKVLGENWKVIRLE